MNDVTGKGRGVCGGGGGVAGVQGTRGFFAGDSHDDGGVWAWLEVGCRVIR